MLSADAVSLDRKGIKFHIFQQIQVDDLQHIIAEFPACDTGKTGVAQCVLDLHADTAVGTEIAYRDKCRVRRRIGGTPVGIFIRSARIGPVGSAPDRPDGAGGCRQLTRWGGVT